MSVLNKAHADNIRNELLDATVKCSERCLYQSAKWAAELASSLPLLDSSNPSFDTDVDSPMQDADLHPPPPSIYSNDDPYEARLEARELPKFLLAKSFFDCREFDRCAAVFLPTDSLRNPLTPKSPYISMRPSNMTVKGKSKEGDRQSRQNIPSNELPLLSQKSLFLALYARYMSGEKRRMEDSEMVLGPTDGGSTPNKELVGLARILESWFADRAAKGLEGSNQGWLEYLFGMVLAKSKTEEPAKRWLLRSINLASFNWSAWLELGELLNKPEELDDVEPALPRNLMALIFRLYERQEFYQSNEINFQELDELERVFPDSDFLKTQRALFHYHAKNLDEADTIFSGLLTSSPHRIDYLDHYSNILFVMANRPKLAFLAQLATATDKFRPETCCVVGNYYSLKSEHEKAVIYFRRALTLDRNFLSAWTLMGHEYVEMKNTHAAIESYRRAVDVNRKDYRAWFGLGQTYEILEMHFYALFYFQRAASLRSSDPKMWQAIAQCYDKVERPLQAIKAYKRALSEGSYYATSSSFESGSSGEHLTGIMDPDILYQIALLHEKLEQFKETAAYMELTMAQEEGPAGEDEDGGVDEESGTGGTGVTNTTSRARMWLAKWELQQGGLQRAMALSDELCEDGFEVEEAKAIIKTARDRLGAQREG